MATPIVEPSFLQPLLKLYYSQFAPFENNLHPSINQSSTGHASTNTKPNERPYTPVDIPANQLHQVYKSRPRFSRSINQLGSNHHISNIQPPPHLPIPRYGYKP